MVAEGMSEKLVKLLNLTTSEVDGEALNAVRFANNLIKKNGLTWETLLLEDRPIEYRVKPKPGTDEPTRVHVVDENDILEIVDFVREKAWPGFDTSFVDSIEKNFEEYGRLTWKQMSALKKVYNTVKTYTEGSR